MKNFKGISIIIPVKDEANSVEKLYTEIVEAVRLVSIFEIIFVDDGSTDNTVSVLKTLPSIRIIQLARNYGQTAAMRAGIENARYEYVTFLDGDGQNDPADIPKLFSKLTDDIDLVCGWRKNRQDKISKRFVSVGARIIRKRIFKDSLHDSGCTLKLLRTKDAIDLNLFGEQHRFIPAIGANKGWKIIEVEVNHRSRQHGVTKYNWRRIFKSYLDMIGLQFWNKYQTRPLHIFGGLGLICFLLGSLSFTVWVAFFILKITFLKYALPIIGLLFVTSGLQLLVMGILSDFLVKNILNITNNNGYKIKN